jgi:hypothetical protein
MWFEQQIDAAAASATAAAISRLVRNPCMKVAWSASSTPKTTTASAPPICRLVLNTPLAVSARYPVRPVATSTQPPAAGARESLLMEVLAVPPYPVGNLRNLGDVRRRNGVRGG